MPFPSSPTNGATYTSAAGVSYTYNGTAWVITAGAGSGLTSVTATAPLSGAGTAASPLVIAQATEAQRGTAEIITQAEADAATAASANDTDILTMKKLLNLGNPALVGLKSKLGMPLFNKSRIAVIGNKYVSSSAAMGVDYSNNGGFTWNRVYNSGGELISASNNLFITHWSTGRPATGYSISSNGSTWTAYASANSMSLLRTYWDGTQWVALAFDTSNNRFYLSSPDAITWTTRAALSPNSVYNGIAKGPTAYVTVHDGGVIVTLAPTTLTQTLRTSGTAVKLNNVIYSSTFSIYIAVGNNGTIITSSNGVTWTSITSGTLYNLRDICFGNGRFVIVTDGGPVLESPDASTWTISSSLNTGQSSSYEDHLATNQVLFDGSQFVTNNGFVFY